MSPTKTLTLAILRLRSPSAMSHGPWAVGGSGVGGWAVRPLASHGEDVYAQLRQGPASRRRHTYH